MQAGRIRNGRGSPGRGAAGAAALWIFVLAPLAAPAEEAAEPPVIELDRLLKLPDSLEIEPETRGGVTRAEWRARFQSAREELAAARAALAKTQTRLAEMAGGTSAWKMGAPGLGAVDANVTKDAPLDYNLSNEMRRNREEVERSERRLAELEVEANLAGVPPEWRATEAGEASATPQGAE